MRILQPSYSAAELSQHCVAAARSHALGAHATGAVMRGDRGGGRNPGTRAGQRAKFCTGVREPQRARFCINGECRKQEARDLSRPSTFQRGACGERPCGAASRLSNAARDRTTLFRPYPISGFPLVSQGFSLNLRFLLYFSCQANLNLAFSEAAFPAPIAQVTVKGIGRVRAVRCARMGNPIRAVLKRRRSNCFAISLPTRMRRGVTLGGPHRGTEAANATCASAQMQRQGLPISWSPGRRSVRRIGMSGPAALRPSAREGFGAAWAGQDL